MPPGSESRPHRCGRTIGYVSGALAALVFAVPAEAGPRNGGAVASPTPAVQRVSCQTGCASIRSAAPGATISVSGRRFGRIASVVFLGRRGDRDDATVKPLRRKRGVVTARVPRAAVTGPVAVINADGAASAPSRTRITIGPASFAPASARSTGPGPGVELEVQHRKVFFDGTRPARLDYMIRSDQPATVEIELVRLSDGIAISRWQRTAVAPNTPQSIAWNGTAGGRVQKDGRYGFRLRAQGSGASASTAQAPQTFTFLRHQFPVRGAHDFGGYSAGFGGGRGHKGQDVFAECGTPLVAARGGTVKFKDFHSRAGHYIVIDGEATGTDYIYMHLQSASPFEKGDRVRTGQVIGAVGDTGRASGCHLHFELWSAPGWYTGGEAMDPKPHLQAWDRSS